MANPFLFDEVPKEAPNPFLFNDAPAPAPPEQANPFLMGGGAAAVAPDMASNPFASYAAPQQNAFVDHAQSGGYYYQQQMQQQQQQQQQQQAFMQPHQQQYAGQFGTYTQVTADNFSQPSVTPAYVPQTTAATVFSQAPSTFTSTLTGVAAFGIETPEPQLPPPAKEEPLPPPPPPPPHIEEDTTPVPPVVPEDESTPLPLPPAPVDEIAPVASDEPLPPPPEEKVKDEIQKPSEEEPHINVEPAGTEDVPEPEKEVARESAEPEASSKGFGEIFNQEVATPPAEPEAAVSADSEIHIENEVKDEEPKEQENQETPKPKSIGASLFDVEDEPPVVNRSAAGAETSSEDEDQEENKTPAEPPKLSTGEAIFADLPAMPDIHSTGASIFGMSEESAMDTTGATLFGVNAPRSVRPALGAMSGWDENFDKKFDQATTLDLGALPPGDPYDPFGGPIHQGSGVAGFSADGFGTGSFMPPAVPQSTPAFARKGDNDFGQGSLADNPFLSMVAAESKSYNYEGGDGEGDDGPLFDDDTSQPLEQFPRISYDGQGWEMFIRHPPKKKLTAQRFWKKVYVKLVMQGDTPCVQLFDSKEAKDPFQELPLQPAYSVSDIAHQVFDQYTKIFTVKLQYIFYKERAGIRPGQISKMQKLAGKVGFLAKAVEDADYEGVKEFASDMKKLGVPLEHAPQVSELLKLGSHSYEDLKQFTVCIEEKLFKMDALRDRSLTYKTEEIQLTAIDEVYVEQNKSGHIIKNLCRIRIFFLSFLTGMPEIELGVNDITRMGLEVVGRHDILPIPTEQWIRYEDIEFHSRVDKAEFEKNNHIIKFQPPDACYMEVMRFRIRPPKARELPMQARCFFEINGNKVVIRADMMIPYQHTKAWGQVPCEDVALRIPLPECWIYQFRTEKHHMSLSQLAAGNLNLSTRMGSVKSAHRRAGKVKGIERFLGALESQSQELMETSSGQAKYEHQHRAIVWRVPRLPKHGQGSYTNHEFICHLQLTSYDQMPESFDKHFYVEFTQPSTCISNTVLRSVSVVDGSGEPPEKFVKYLARHEYKLEIEFTEKELNPYLAVSAIKKEEPKPAEEEESPQGDPDFPDENGQRKDSDSDSD